MRRRKRPLGEKFLLCFCIIFYIFLPHCAAGIKMEVLKAQGLPPIDIYAIDRDGEVKVRVSCVPCLDVKLVIIGTEGNEVRTTSYPTVRAGAALHRVSGFSGFKLNKIIVVVQEVETHEGTYTLEREINPQEVVNLGQAALPLAGFTPRKPNR